MKWTLSQPTSTGWYFYQRLPADDGRTFPVRCGFVDFTYDWKTDSYAALLRGCDDRQSNNGKHCLPTYLMDIHDPHRWAGPVDAPEEDPDV